MKTWQKITIVIVGVVVIVLIGLFQLVSPYIVGVDASSSYTCNDGSQFVFDARTYKAFLSINSSYSSTTLTFNSEKIVDHNVYPGAIDLLFSPFDDRFLPQTSLDLKNDGYGVLLVSPEEMSRENFAKLTKCIAREYEDFTKFSKTYDKDRNGDTLRYIVYSDEYNSAVEFECQTPNGLTTLEVSPYSEFTYRFGDKTYLSGRIYDPNRDLQGDSTKVARWSYATTDVKTFGQGPDRPKFAPISSYAEGFTKNPKYATELGRCVHDGKKFTDLYQHTGSISNCAYSYREVPEC